MSIKGIKKLEIEDLPNGSYRVIVTYTEEFVDVLKKVLKTKKITHKDVTGFISNALEDYL
jgi:hypothetical protein